MIEQTRPAKKSPAYKAAIAAGAGLGFASGAGAQVISTWDNSTVANVAGEAEGKRFELDLNGDAVVDFYLYYFTSYYSDGYGGGYHYAWLDVDIPGGGATHNRVLSLAQGNNNYAAALSVGDLIGSSPLLSVGAAILSPAADQHDYRPGRQMHMADSIFTVTNALIESYGTFVGADNRYLGLEFVIPGPDDLTHSTHYGWLCLDVDGVSLEATLCGYAYESEQEVGIEAGTIPEPDSMLLMAAGALPLLAYRRKRAKQKEQASSGN